VFSSEHLTSRVFGDSALTIRSAFLAAGRTHLPSPRLPTYCACSSSHDRFASCWLATCRGVAANAEHTRRIPINIPPGLVGTSHYAHSPRNITSKRPCMVFRTLLRCFSRTRSPAFDNTQQPHRDSQQLTESRTSDSQGPSARAPEHQQGPSTASPHQSVNSHTHTAKKADLMPKRKAEESAEIMDAPAKKTKAAPKKSRKTAEEGKCNTLLISRSIHNHGGDANCGGENMRMDISMPYHRGTTDVSAPTAASNRASYPESLPVVHQQRDHLPGAGLPQFRFTPCPSLTLLTIYFLLFLHSHSHSHCPHPALRSTPAILLTTRPPRSRAYGTPTNTRCLQHTRRSRRMPSHSS
jgi:hypothetical protein